MGSVGLLAVPVFARQATPPAESGGDSQTVIVQGKAPEVVHKIDRSVYDMKDNPRAATGNVSDVLSTLPSVSVDANGNVSVRGGSVQVMVDGKPSAALKGANLATALQTMPANSVARIEVITNPGAEFRTDAATVINIITRKVSGKGPSGTLTLNAGTAARYNAAIAGEVTRAKWTFSGSASQREDQRSNYIFVDRITTDGNGDLLTHFVQDSRVKVRVHVTALDGSVSYAAGDNDTLSLAGNVTLRNRPRRDADGYVFLDPAGSVTSAYVNHARGRQYFNVASLNGTWKHKGGRDGETFTVQLRHEEDENLRDFRYDRVFTVPVSPDLLYRRAHTSRELTDGLDADYVLPLGSDRQFKTGMSVQYDRVIDANLSTTTDPAGLEVVDASLTNGFLIDQRLAAAYTDYQQPLGKWVIEGGLRVETLETRLRQTRAAAATIVSNTQWAPSLYLSRTLSDAQKLHFGYSHRIDRPTADQLNPLEYPLDAQDVLIGNPFLKPGQTESFEGGYDYTGKGITFAGTLYARRLSDTVIDYYYYRNPGDTILVTSFTNAGSGHSEGASLSLTLKPKGKVSYALDTDIFNLSQTTPIGGADVERSVTSHITKASLTWTPRPADMLQIQAQLNGKTLSAQGVSSGTNMLNLNYSHKVSARLKLVVTATDVLNSVKIDQLIRTDTFRDRTRIEIPGQIVYVGLTYRMGAVDGKN